MKKLLLTLLLFSAGTGISAAKTYDLKSPDGKIAVRVDVGADALRTEALRPSTRPSASVSERGEGAISSLPSREME